MNTTTTTTTTTRPSVPDMAKVAKAVANLTPSQAIRRANAYHDLPPVDAHRRRRLHNPQADHCPGFGAADFLH